MIYSTGTLTLNNFYVTENKAVDGYDPPSGNDGPPGSGGEIFSVGTLNMTNTWIYGNKAGKGENGEDGGIGSFGGWGVGIYNGNDTLIINSIIHQNRAGDGGRGGDDEHDDVGMGGEGGHGGGLYCPSCNLTVVNTIISSNYAGQGGDGRDVTGIGPVSGRNGGQGGFGGGFMIAGAEATANLWLSTVKYNQCCRLRLQCRRDGGEYRAQRPLPMRSDQVGVNPLLSSLADNGGQT